MSEEEAGDRWRHAFAALGERATPGPECPEPDRLWAAAAGESPPAERHEIILHTASCSSCAAAFRLARGLAAGEAVPLPSASRLRWVRWSAPLAALAAALILAVLAPAGWWKPNLPYRGGDTLEIRSQLPDGTVLPRARADLQWTGGPAGSLYEVRVLTRDGREIAVEAGLGAPRYRIPPAALSGLRSGSVLYWQVRAVLPDGRTLVSKTFSARLE